MKIEILSFYRSSMINIKVQIKKMSQIIQNFNLILKSERFQNKRNMAKKNEPPKLVNFRSLE